MSPIIIIVASIVGLIAGFAAAYFVATKMSAAKIQQAEESAKNILKDAEKEANNIKKEKIIEAKEEWHKRKLEFENDALAKRQKLQQIEKQLKSVEDDLKRKENDLNKKENEVKNYEENLKKKEAELTEKAKEIDTIIAEQMKKLESIAGLSSEEAKKQLMEAMINDAKQDAANTIRQIR
ncbi:MAG TPA: Rnase Y domain-containing protein, partial [Candidatus Kapabacteria bacterium]|nr:Rnase Y domain-containing protein [Candidatus Kapabacteria bacterium]